MSQINLGLINFPNKCLYKLNFKIMSGFENRKLIFRLVSIYVKSITEHQENNTEVSWFYEVTGTYKLHIKI